MRTVADLEIFRLDPNVLRPQFCNLFDERQRINHHPVPNHADFLSPQDTGGDETENVFLIPVNNGVTGVVTALAANDDLRRLRKHVDDFAFPLVAPLCAN